MTETKPITVFVSKYAANGIITKEEVWDDQDGYVRRRYTYQSLLLGRDAHLTEGDAVKAAKAARDRRLASLRKQVQRLEALTFSVVSK
ncbi:MAG: hypothetical protein ACK4RV_10480 [Caulobacter sp.]